MNNFSACRRKDTLHAFRAKIQFFSCTCIQKRCFLRIIIQSIGENRKKHTFLPHSNDFSAGKFSDCRGTALLLPWENFATATGELCAGSQRTLPRQRQCSATFTFPDFCLYKYGKNKPFACAEMQTKGFYVLRVLARMGKDARKLANAELKGLKVTGRQRGHIANCNGS